MSMTAFGISTKQIKVKEGTAYRKKLALGSGVRLPVQVKFGNPMMCLGKQLSKRLSAVLELDFTRQIR